MRENIGDRVVLSLSSEEIEYELANLEDLEVVLLSKLTDGQDRKELRQTFDVAKTAMQMIWCAMNTDGEELTEADMKLLQKTVNKRWAENHIRRAGN